MQIRFGNCLIDTETRRVVRGDTDVALSRKAYRLLMQLVEARPKAVAKEALYQALWPDTFVVEANLSNLVGEVRAGLGDARAIRTLHGYGYAFAAEAAVTSTDSIQSDITGYLIKADGQVLPLPGSTCVIGRGLDVQVRLDLPGISRHHARITIRDARAIVEDLQSKNGTFVRGERVGDPCTAISGDELGFGSLRVTLRISSPTLTTETTR